MPLLERGGSESSSDHNNGSIRKDAPGRSFAGNVKKGAPAERRARILAVAQVIGLRFHRAAGEVLRIL